jgi:hypothetical protein
MRPDITDDDLGKLVERVREAAGALMQGDVRRYFALVKEAPDYTLMPPTAGRRDTGPTRRRRASRHWRSSSPAVETRTSSSSSRTPRATLSFWLASSGSTVRSAACPLRTGRFV